MTDQSKIEAAAIEQLEELAREVACEKVGQCFSQGTDIMLIARAVKAAKYAYLACHASRDAEIADLSARLAAMREPLWMLREEHGVANVVSRTKSNYSAPADAHIIGEIKGWDAVVSGIGD